MSVTKVDSPGIDIREQLLQLKGVCNGPVMPINTWLSTSLCACFYSYLNLIPRLCLHDTPHISIMSRVHTSILLSHVD